MPAEQDLRVALLGLKRNFFSLEQLLECGELLAQDSSRSLARILESEGYIDEKARAELEALAAEKPGNTGEDSLVNLDSLCLDGDAGGSFPGLDLAPGLLGSAGETALLPSGRGSETQRLERAPEGRFRLGPEIGRGGLGRVVAGEDMVLGREVAIKEMLRASDPGLIRRFLREGEVAGRLMHPNIVPVFDVGVREEAGRKIPYFAMGFIRGMDLKEIIAAVERGSWKSGQPRPAVPDDPSRDSRGSAVSGETEPAPLAADSLPLTAEKDPRKEFNRPRLLRAFQDVCRAIAYAHDHGVIHRDLKPANVMIGKYGEVYVVDWGLAKLTHAPDQPDAPSGQTDQPDRGAADPRGMYTDDQSGFLTMDGTVLGTPAYMPPEQARGRRADIDERSDVYALGAILYEILTFRPPFEGPSGLNVIAKVLTGNLTPPSQKVSEIRRSKTALTDQPDQQVAERRSKYADDRYKHSEITEKILGCYYEVYNRLRPGHKKSVYENALLIELRKYFADVKAQERLEARYKDDRVGGYKPDILVDGKIIIEIKAATTLIKDHELQLSRYLKATGIEAGLVLNFGALKPEFKRKFIASDQVDQSPPTPSLVTDQVAADQVDQVFPEPVPAELESIVMKAMAMDKGARYASARELHDDVQRFLDGEKQREHNRMIAMAKVEEGRALARLMKSLSGEAEAAASLVKEAESKIEDRMPVEAKRGYWALQEREKTLRLKVVEKFTAAVNSFQEALGFERRNAGARSALAGLYWEKFVAAENSGDESEALQYEAMLRQYDDGEYGARLKGDGTLAISTRSYPCHCLTEGRMVAPEELSGERVKGEGWEGEVAGPVEGGAESRALNPLPSTLDPSKCGIMGYHPFSGRSLDGNKGAEGLRYLEPKEPIRLKVHGADCKAEAITGADVWLVRFEEHDKILVPVMPSGISAGVECRVLSVEKQEGQDRLRMMKSLRSAIDALYDKGSPFKPSEALYLGKTPVPRFALPMGSYLLIIAKSGGDSEPCQRALHSTLETRHSSSGHYHPVRCPVCIGRLADEEAEVTLYREGEIPDGFVQVPAGKFFYQGDLDTPYSGPVSVEEQDDFFMAKFPATCAEYLDFLNLGAAAHGQENRAPRKTPTAGSYWPRDELGNFAIPTEKWVEGAPEHLRKQASKLEMSPVWWDEQWPVLSVSWEDMMVYAAWKTRGEGRLYALPHEVAWEKAARGADGRTYPWGGFCDAAFCNSSKSHEGGARPVPVDSFPLDESPCGARGLGGNARDLCLNSPGTASPGWRLCRGGAWPTQGVHLRSANRSGDAASNVRYTSGGRLCWLPVIGARGVVS